MLTKLYDVLEQHVKILAFLSPVRFIMLLYYLSYESFSQATLRRKSSYSFLFLIMLKNLFVQKAGHFGIFLFMFLQGLRNGDTVRPDVLRCNLEVFSRRTLKSSSMDRLSHPTDTSLVLFIIPVLLYIGYTLERSHLSHLTIKLLQKIIE